MSYDTLQIFNKWIIIIIDNVTQLANRANIIGLESAGLG